MAAAKLIGALLVQWKSTKVICGRKPHAEGIAFRDWLFNVSLSRFQNLDIISSEKERERIRLKIENLRAKIKVLNGRPWLNQVEHMCYIEDEADGVVGTPCCASVAETQKKVAEVYQEVVSFIIDGQNVASQHDWFKPFMPARHLPLGQVCTVSCLARSVRFALSQKRTLTKLWPRIRTTVAQPCCRNGSNAESRNS